MFHGPEQLFGSPIFEELAERFSLGAPVRSELKQPLHEVSLTRNQVAVFAGVIIVCTFYRSVLGVTLALARGATARRHSGQVRNVNCDGVGLLCDALCRGET